MVEEAPFFDRTRLYNGVGAEPQGLKVGRSGRKSRNRQDPSFVDGPGCAWRRVRILFGFISLRWPGWVTEGTAANAGEQTLEGAYVPAILEARLSS